MPHLILVSFFFFILHGGGAPELWRDESYRKVSLGKRADREQAMLDLMNTVAQRARLSWRLGWSRTQACQKDAFHPSTCCGLPDSFSVMLLSHVGEGSPFWATLTLLRRTLGMLPPSRSRSTDVGTILQRYQGVRISSQESETSNCNKDGAVESLSFFFFRDKISV